MSDLLATLVSSDKRRNLLLLLRSGPRTWDEIKTLLNVTATGMLPQIKILEDENLLKREDKIFSLTPMGNVLANHMEPFIGTVNVFDKNKKFWQEHAIGELTREILFDIRDLGNYRILENSDEEIFDINSFLNNIAGAKSVKGISHTIHPKYPHFFLSMAEKGTDASLIFTPGVFKILKEKYHSELDAALKIRNLRMYVTKKDIKFSFTVTESYFSISLFYKNGVFDSKNDVVSRDPSALLWGERIFEHFKAQSDLITHTD
jgi:predicted transcriptional regulator